MELAGAVSDKAVLAYIEAILGRKPLASPEVDNWSKLEEMGLCPDFAKEEKKHPTYRSMQTSVRVNSILALVSC